VRILYGAVGEGLGHATRSGVVAEHLIAQGHHVKMVASGRAFPYLAERLPDVEEIWGFSFALQDGQVDTWQTILKNVRGARSGVPENWKQGSAIAEAFDPEMVITDFDGFAYLVARLRRIPAISLGNIQMVARCAHDDAITAGVRTSYLQARAFVTSKLPRAQRYLILTFFHPEVRAKRTALVPPILRDEIVAARPEAGEHLLAYGRMAQASVDALAATGVPTLVYGARDGLREDVREGSLTYRPFSNDGFVEDLRTCRGVVASAGFSLMCEAVYLRKPMLAVPLAGQFEQVMNARYLERLGYGLAAEQVDAQALERFFAREDEHVEALSAYAQDGNRETLETVERTVGELRGGRRR
jgi:uncharacterized protein (TIGR00661 family)